MNFLGFLHDIIYCTVLTSNEQLMITSD